ncbi:tetratricopeptide repeat protein 36 homolog [Condylostylus longicornis]|uniref:tetratricopeptide repeat protein 36 homolog n=1 Tax=Condylostylus longicornis TaxID=2530218 RepID=UPI00244E21AF|nr:tetratricopeptide repeat protein 36 homolog [Condylostylus longicornis]
MSNSKIYDQLSKKDKEVLDSVFNPYQIGGEVGPIGIFNAEITDDIIDPIEENTPEIEKSKTLEIEAVKLAEDGKIDKSLELFNNAIEYGSQRPTLYNNRAQSYRLKGDDKSAFNDLNKAIQLSSDFNYKRTACLAYCQRGILHRKYKNIDEARHDFEEAAKLGSKFAKTQLVEINPYAALCNQMLREAFQKLS